MRCCSRKSNGKNTCYAWADATVDDVCRNNNKVVVVVVAVAVVIQQNERLNNPYYSVR